MTQHRELAVTIARAVFDKIEDDRMLVSSNIEQVIEDQLILHAAKGGQPEWDRLTQTVTIALRDADKFIAFLNDMNAPMNVVSAARRLLACVR